MLWYAHDNESGRVWIIGADSEADAAARADISVWMIRPLGDSFKGVITFNPEQWESNTVSPALETRASPIKVRCNVGSGPNDRLEPFDDVPDEQRNQK